MEDRIFEVVMNKGDKNGHYETISPISSANCKTNKQQKTRKN